MNGKAPWRGLSAAVVLAVVGLLGLYAIRWWRHPSNFSYDWGYGPIHFQGFWDTETRAVDFEQITVLTSDAAASGCVVRMNGVHFQLNGLSVDDVKALGAQDWSTTIESGYWGLTDQDCYFMSFWFDNNGLLMQWTYADYDCAPKRTKIAVICNGVEVTLPIGQEQLLGRLGEPSHTSKTRLLYER